MGKRRIPGTVCFSGISFRDSFLPDLRGTASRGPCAFQYISYTTDDWHDSDDDTHSGMVLAITG